MWDYNAPALTGTLVLKPAHGGLLACIFRELVRRVNCSPYSARCITSFGTATPRYRRASPAFRYNASPRWRVSAVTLVRAGVGGAV